MKSREDTEAQRGCKNTNPVKIGRMGDFCLYNGLYKSVMRVKCKINSKLYTVL